MKQFTNLFEALDSTNKTNEKVKALVQYFQEASDADKVWCIALLTDKRPRRPVKTAEMRLWAAELAGLPTWLFEESYHIAGDLSETIALVLPPPITSSEISLHQLMQEMQAWPQLTVDERKHIITTYWKQLNTKERFVFNKLIGGGFRMGVSQLLLTRALAQYLNRPAETVAHRLMGNWNPNTTSFKTLIEDEHAADDASRPYPFYLAHSLEDDPTTLGSIDEWQAEYKWDGIRGQLIYRQNQLFVWSRGEELVTDKFPEFHQQLDALPNQLVLDGEILPFAEGQPLSFQTLQTRIGRKNVTKKVLADAPVVFMVYDVLEYNGIDIREWPLAKRRAILETLTKHGPDWLIPSPVLQTESWQALQKIRLDARQKNSEGLMLKRKDAPYKVGRKRGDWWKWKLDPLSIDAVLIYAQRGHGRRANLYTDYTFAVWDGEQLVPFAKAYSGLTDEEIVKVDKFVKASTQEKFGPVRSVTPTLVFEIGFEGIHESPRHRSGVALRFPRILRWRTDKTADQANTLHDLKTILKLYNG